MTMFDSNYKRGSLYEDVAYYCELSRDSFYGGLTSEVLDSPVFEELLRIYESSSVRDSSLYLGAIIAYVHEALPLYEHFEDNWTPMAHTILPAMAQLRKLREAEMRAIKRIKKEKKD